MTRKQKLIGLTIVAALVFVTSTVYLLTATGLSKALHLSSISDMVHKSKLSQMIHQSPVSQALHRYYFPSVEGADFNKPTVAEVDLVISGGIGHLSREQLPSGEFTVFACKPNNDCEAQSTPFISSHILYSLSAVDDSRVEPIKTELSEHLLENREEINGTSVWRFWNKSSKRHDRLPPDMDDTACVAGALMKNGAEFPQNLSTLDTFMNKDGVFPTYLTTAKEQEKLINGNDVGCVVNANALYYYAMHGRQPKTICDYLNRYVKDPSSKPCSIYYRNNNYSLAYALSKAYAEGATCLDESRQIAIDKLVSAQNDSGMWQNDLYTAAVTVALINYGYEGEAVDKGIRYLIKQQQADGSWDAANFFEDPVQLKRYNVSGLTTALSLEALSKYKTNL